MALEACQQALSPSLAFGGSRCGVHRDVDLVGVLNLGVFVALMACELALSHSSACRVSRRSVHGEVDDVVGVLNDGALMTCQLALSPSSALEDLGVTSIDNVITCVKHCSNSIKI